MTNINSPQTRVLSLLRDASFQSEAAQIQAKALLSEVAEQIPAYKWTYIARRVARNLSVATFELENIARTDLQALDQLSEAALKFARIWEALSKLHEGSTRGAALLNSAVNYELAGYQA